MLSNILVVAFVTACLTGSISAVEPRAGSVCSDGIYKELVPILAPYSVAQAFCTAKYPVKCTTRLNKRVTPTTTSSNRQSTTTTTTKSSTTTTKSTTTIDAKASAWAKAQLQAGQVVSTLCSCLQGPAKACSSTSKTTGTTTSPVSTTKSIRTTSMISTGTGTTSKTSISTTTTTRKITTSSTSGITTSSKTSSTTTRTSTTSSSSTSSTTSSITTTTSTSTTSVVTTSTTSSTSAVHTVDAPRCNPADNGDTGDCSDFCVCLTDNNGLVAYCGSLPEEPSCDVDEDCAQGSFCAYNSAQCVQGTQPERCESTYVPGTKRSLFDAPMGRMSRRRTL